MGISESNRDGCEVRVVADWVYASRTAHWIDELRRLQEDDPPFARARLFRPDPATGQWEEYRLEGDGLIAVRPSCRTYDLLSGCDVLILNWDAVNGDAVYGSHFTLAWFEHRQMELRYWLQAGGILIVDGQTTDHVPEQRAYDALFGRRELRVSGLADPLHPGDQEGRSGDVCRVTWRGRRTRFFADQRVIRGITAPHEAMFGHSTVGPREAATEPGGPEDRDETEHRTRVSIARWANERRPLASYGLYRGWFVRSPFRRQRYAWTPLLKTGDRPWAWDHPTLLATRVEASRHRPDAEPGAIFASSMFLARTDQEDLVRHLIQTHGRVDREMPSGRRAGERVASAVPATVIPATVAAAAGVSLSRPVGQVLLYAAGAGLANALRRYSTIGQTIRRTLRHVTGW